MSDLGHDRLIVERERGASWVYLVRQPPGQPETHRRLLSLSLTHPPPSDADLCERARVYAEAEIAEARASWDAMGPELRILDRSAAFREAPVEGGSIC